MRNFHGPHRVALAGLLVLASCAPPRVPPAAPEPEREPERGAEAMSATYVYDCGPGDRFSARVTLDRATLRMGARTVTLPQVIAASGTRYEGEGITFWSKGLEAMLDTPGSSRQGCIGQEASTPWAESRLLGYDFRAVGQEPGWMVEIDAGREIHLVADYGERQLQAPAATPITREGVTTYRTRAGADDLIVAIRRERCVDTMSGEEYPAKVTVELSGRDLQGCGRELAGPTGVPLPGARWLLTQLDGVPALAAPGGGQPFLRFGAERIEGSTGCNTIAGPYEASGDQLRILEPLVMTRRACIDPALAAQEQSLVAALARADRFTIWGETLSLHAGTQVIARFSSAP